MISSPLHIDVHPTQQPDGDNIPVPSGRWKPIISTDDYLDIDTWTDTMPDADSVVFSVYTGALRLLKSEISTSVGVEVAGIESYRHLQSQLQAYVGVAFESQQSRIYMDLGSHNAISVEVKRNVSDTAWTLDAELAGLSGPAMHKHMRYSAIDANGNKNWLFTGIIPDKSYSLQVAANRNSITAYDYGFYLSSQRISYTETTMNLQGDYTTWDEWITHLLEGTRIHPYKINTCVAEDREFTFTPKTTKMEAIQEIADYTKFVFYVRWVNESTDEDPNLQPVAYFVHQDDIDDPIDGLDLPAPYTVTFAEPTLVDIPEIKTIINDSYNRVIVRGNDDSGNWYVAVEEAATVAAGEDMAREYYEESSYWNTQAKTDNRASELLGFFTSDRNRVRATFIKRHDLRPWQKIRFEGVEFPDRLTDMGWLRIVYIRHSINSVNETVTIEAIPDTDIGMQWIDRSNTDNVTETEQIVDYKLERQPGPQIGTVIAIDGNVATVETERGDIVKARIVDE